MIKNESIYFLYGDYGVVELENKVRFYCYYSYGDVKGYFCFVVINMDCTIEILMVSKKRKTCTKIKWWEYTTPVCTTHVGKSFLCYTDREEDLEVKYELEYSELMINRQFIISGNVVGTETTNQCGNVYSKSTIGTIRIDMSKIYNDTSYEVVKDKKARESCELLRICEIERKRIKKLPKKERERIAKSSQE
jgi:hypothetical protein